VFSGCEMVALVLSTITATTITAVVNRLNLLPAEEILTVFMSEYEHWKTHRFAL